MRRFDGPARLARPALGHARLDDFLDTDGTREAFQAFAVKVILTYQLEQAMRDQRLSRRRLAERMGTSRSQFGRFPDPTDRNVTLATLQRVAEIIGCKVRLDLI